MFFLYLNSNNYIIRKWAYGYTKEILIFPFNSDYYKKNFEFRISSASIKKKKSIFNKFNNYKRLIMTLNNEIYLKHLFKNNKKIVVIKPFKTYKFLGELKTISYGICIDFNLIYCYKYDCNMFIIKELIFYKFKPNIKYLLYFLDFCNIQIFKGGEHLYNYNLKPTESLVFITSINDKFYFRLKFFKKKNNKKIVIGVKIKKIN